MYKHVLLTRLTHSLTSSLARGQLTTRIRIEEEESVHQTVGNTGCGNAVHNAYAEAGIAFVLRVITVKAMRSSDVR